MIEQLAEHGVTSEDLVPSLVATYTMDNPEYDPEAAEEAAQEADIAVVPDVASPRRSSDFSGLPDDPPRPSSTKRRRTPSPPPELQIPQSVNDDVVDSLGDLALGQDEERREEEEAERLPGHVRNEVRKIERRASQAALRSPSPTSPAKSRTSRAHSLQPVDPDAFDNGGDIGAALDDPPTPTAGTSELPRSPRRSQEDGKRRSIESAAPDSDDSRSSTPEPSTPKASSIRLPAYDVEDPLEEASAVTDDLSSAVLPSTLPGVTKKVTSLDRTVTLDIRWTVLCDLFLALIADSVYDARSRVLLGRLAEKLGLEWMDVVRFERRLTEALEIQEAVKQKEHTEVLEGRRLKDRQKRYLMMGLATVGGGLVIGLSAGLLAPVIGAGLGAALTTVGIGGTSTFLSGAGGIALISTGATLSGASIGGKAMARRTRDVKTFDVQPLHNNKRVNFFLTIPGCVVACPPQVRLRAPVLTFATVQVHGRPARRCSVTVQHHRSGRWRRPIDPLGTGDDGRHRQRAQDLDFRSPFFRRPASPRRNPHGDVDERAPVAHQYVQALPSLDRVDFVANVRLVR